MSSFVRGVLLNNYAGETSQSLCCTFNSHRANRKRLGQQQIYRHFDSDGHSRVRGGWEEGGGREGIVIHSFFVCLFVFLFFFLFL